MSGPKHTPGPIFLDSFSGSAANLKPSLRTPQHVLSALRRDPRVSTFDMSECSWLCGCIDILKRDGHITEDESEPYPWHRYVITAATGPAA
ncbi:MAG: hypothetical protein PHR85_14640 [Malikia sp.]|nr:hypothetical protein [Malikia sp.]